MRYLNSFLITTIIYVGLISLFLFTNPFEKISQNKKDEEKKISLNYVQIVKQKVVPIKEEIKKVTTEKVEHIQNKIIEKKIVKKVESKKSVIKKETKKIIAKKTEKPIKKVEEKIIENFVKKEIPKNEVVEKLVNVKPQTKKIITAQKTPSYEECFLQEHLLQIRKEIQKHVKYSKKAKKLKIQGKVLVEFALNTNGTIDYIKTLEGHKFLQKSTIDAIYSASSNFPKVEKSITIKIPIEYKLI